MGVEGIEDERAKDGVDFDDQPKELGCVGAEGVRLPTGFGVRHESSGDAACRLAVALALARDSTKQRITSINTSPMTVHTSRVENVEKKWDMRNHCFEVRLSSG